MAADKRHLCRIVIGYIENRTGKGLFRLEAISVIYWPLLS